MRPCARRGHEEAVPDVAVVCSCSKAAIYYLITTGRFQVVEMRLQVVEIDSQVVENSLQVVENCSQVVEKSPQLVDKIPPTPLFPTAPLLYPS